MMSRSAANCALLVAGQIDELHANARTEDCAVAALTVRMVAGEEAAWREFHAAYFDRLLRYLLVVTRGDENAARESLQTALVKIVRHVRRFDREEALWSWLTVVGRSCVIDGARGQTRYRALLERYAGVFSSLPDVALHEPLPGLLEECMAELSSAEQALLAGKYRDGQSVASLALESGCSEKAMESRLARLRLRLKTQLLKLLRNAN